ncbi:MAG: aldehyde dehydrogenase family protein, partial [Bacteroidetes bacterium]|nr:aldehyde dehydrogenase family protein [Bacteroidota bacterium]
MTAATDVKTFGISQSKIFINNQFVESVSGKTFATLNPATGSEITQVSEGDAADINAAVAAARQAFSDGGKWSKSSGGRRG